MDNPPSPGCVDSIGSTSTILEGRPCPPSHSVYGANDQNIYPGIDIALCLPLPPSEPHSPAQLPGDILHQTGAYQEQPEDAEFTSSNASCDQTGKATLKPSKNFFQILELISEQGNGGLVDKIIISQDSLGQFINLVCPNAYTSLTKVDFKKLDNLKLQPLGIYGPKESIFSFLVETGITDISKHKEFRHVDNALASGLYVATKSDSDSDRSHIYPIYWPEDTTWDDDAPASVRKNRITFMRYLNKITDQVLCLLPEEMSRKLVFEDLELATEVTFDVEDDQHDRLFSFEVSKTLEQEENVLTREGFTLSFSKELGLAGPDVLESQNITLLKGETCQGLLKADLIPPVDTTSFLKEQKFNAIQLRELCNNRTIKLEQNFSNTALESLIKDGLSQRFPSLCASWNEHKQAIDKLIENTRTQKQQESRVEVEKESDKLRGIILNELMRRILEAYPSCEFNAPFTGQASEDPDRVFKDVQDMYQIYPQVKTEVDSFFKKGQLSNVDSKEYRKYKKQLLTIRTLLEDFPQLAEDERQNAVQMVYDKSANTDLDSILPQGAPKNSFRTFLASLWISKPHDASAAFQSKVFIQVGSISDTTFLADLKDLTRYGGSAAEGSIQELHKAVTSHFETMITLELPRLVSNVKHAQQKVHNHQIDIFLAHQKHQEYVNLRASIVEELRSASEAMSAESSEVCFADLEAMTPVYSYNYRGIPAYKVTATVKSRTDPSLEYKIFALELTSDHRQNLQLDGSFVPQPLINRRLSSSFRFPPNHTILHAQLLANNKILVVVDNHVDTISIFCETFGGIGQAVTANRPKKVVRKEKTGNDVVITFDECKRMLALCSSAKKLLYIFVFEDETFTKLQSWANAINLLPWYEGAQKICHLCFVTGDEELLLVDDNNQARIFSLVTQQCRPASLELPQSLCAVLSSPDGACFFAVFDTRHQPRLRAYHWATFGSSNGIDINMGPGFHPDQLCLTSFVNRSSVHILGLDLENLHCQSIVCDITKKSTEFMFQEKSATLRNHRSTDSTIHNCVLDCHYDTWTRFPVLPAFQRLTKSSNTIRRRRTLVFVTDFVDVHFRAYFTRLIKTFEQKVRKPGTNILHSIFVDAITPRYLVEGFLRDFDISISEFKAGEWVVDLLCLIPIHIAITRENRFIPLKDGVISAEYERSLLGAEVSNIVDSISFGWYESIFQTYMATKPVKVVSSMGEQSVGKSYALNHLMDTSFAGSAMRTTEGVWMSVTPTDDFLLVALDFEGVHSIERSAQEDTLLVLFNTAISNLVLFRNNFALSRDITGLFQSFQSSSSVFDPAANPTLFRSTLAIIIKDVVDSDKKEIVREFSLKFQKIVQDEQESNFISRLHAGQLKIIPWPVIESKQFYSLFPAIKTVLDKQLVTHSTAGSFLLTLKTLMAKLKANDWRALSQSMVAHRVHQLLSILPNALAFGYTEVEPELEELKNLDTDVTIDFAGDTPCRIFLSTLDHEAVGPDASLKALCESWDGYHSRHTRPEGQWADDLSSYINRLVDTRIQHVESWVAQNVESFQISGQTSLTTLRRVIEPTIIDIRANNQLCRQQCSSCQLTCLLSARHDGNSHNCLTSHKCVLDCDFVDEHHDAEIHKTCGHPAGHSGKHVCVVERHLCGEPCFLKDKAGCLGECTQVAGHTNEEHRCSARVHYCGRPCHLNTTTESTRPTVGIGGYRCPGTCTISSDIEHETHLCDNRMCPVKCALCKRFCVSDDHLHSMDQAAIHLCGEIHPCKALCSASGICEIDTAPQSIEATFTGQHSTFQYTKYSQVAKRLPCVKPIPPMELIHSGSHCHSNDSQPFHFCETRCVYCSYYCTLPRGHSQQEHETSHGSMSKSRWAVESSDAVLELNGRKFGSNDDGAPMMCNLFCQEMGRHVHIDYCRPDSDGNCNGQDIQHIQGRINPNPEKPKDWITHELFWKRSGFKDPYSRDDKLKFAKCDAMCPGSEHTSGTASSPAQPSYCTLPMFHAPHRSGQGAGLGYVSNDGHLFSCKNPALLQQAFHVIFVVDRSGSMGSQDRRPLEGTPVTARITRSHNNRLGAVYSALYGFWTSRVATVNTVGQNSQMNGPRRDSYSVILFESMFVNCISNDFTSSPDQLLDRILQYRAGGGTSYSNAVRCAEEVMRQYWSTERAPIIIFLSDGECDLKDENMRTLCRAAIALGKPLSFHGVSFGTNNQILRRMVQIAREIQASHPRDPLVPAASIIESSFAEVLDSVRLAETFLGLAESLKKPRGSLFT